MMKQMKVKQRRFGPGEFASIARQCMDEIMAGRSVLDYLARKGIENPANEWYDIRRWIKSNMPTWYEQIPTNLKLEMPVQRINPDCQKQTEVVKKEEPVQKPEVKEEPEMPAEEVKRKPGRPPRAKVEETVTPEKRPRNVAQKPSVKMTINSVSGKKFRYTRNNDGGVSIINNEMNSKIELFASDIPDLIDELKEVVRLFEL